MKQKLIFTGIILFAMLSFSCGEKLTFEEQIKKDISNIKSIKECNSVPEGAVITNVTFGNLNPTPGTSMYVVFVEYDYTITEKTTHIKNSYIYFKRGESYEFSKVVGGCDK